jgi:cyanophycin synthetase
MEFLKILNLRGPNFWSRRTVLEAWVDLKDLAEVASHTVPTLYDRVNAWMPGLVEHRCGVGERGGFLLRLRDGTYPAHVMEHVAVELQNMCGTRVGFGKARQTSLPGVYKVAVRYRDENVGQACLKMARDVVEALLREKPYDFASAFKDLRAYADDIVLGPSTNAVLDAAEARSIPARRLNDGSLVQLGQGVHMRRIWTAETDRTGAIAEWVAKDKALTKQLLKSVGVPVPEGAAVESPGEAWEVAQDIGLPVVVKPRDANHGRGVFLELSSREEVERAYSVAKDEGTGVVVEKYLPGNEHRVLVVGNRVVAAARGQPVHVTGDGEHTVEELVGLQLNTDPRRGYSDDFPLNPVDIDSAARSDLARQGLEPTSVPARGRQVLIQRNGNVAFDVTDNVHTDVADRLVSAAKVVGLDIAGVDVVTPDISRPLEEVGGAVVEVNAGPGLHMHLMPAEGKPRPVGEAILDLLYPEGQDGRIPVCCVTGTNGKTTVTRLVAHVLRAAGRCTGMACTDGLWVGQRVLDAGDCAGPDSARRLLVNPVVQAAVLEAGRGGILREGLGFDRCQVAVVTNVGEADHLGPHFIETPEDMVQVKRCPVDMVLPKKGTAVLNAADPLVAGMAGYSQGFVTFFAVDRDHPVLVAHRAQGKRTVSTRDGMVLLGDGDKETPLVNLVDVPLTHGGRVGFQVENVLAAAGACWAMGLPLETTRLALQTFRGDAVDLPARFNVTTSRDVVVVADDSHNVSALEALVRALDGLPKAHRTAAYSAGKERRDQDIVRQGELLARAFDRVILYQDGSATDRAPGDLARLFRQGLKAGGRVTDIQETSTHAQAAQRALDLAGPGDVVVVQAEDSGTAATAEIVRAWAAARDLATGATA